MSSNDVRQTGEVHEPVRDAASRFLRGEASVVDFTYAFRNAINVVTVDRRYVVRAGLRRHGPRHPHRLVRAHHPAIPDRYAELILSAEAVGAVKLG